MTISVIIPTLNEEHTIPASLSRLRQPAFTEIVIVDGGSHDSTLARAATIAPTARILSTQKGRARQMNAGAAAATGDVLLFLHADTLLPLSAGAEIEAALQDPEVVGGRFDARLDQDSGLFWLICRMMNWRSRFTGIATGDQAPFLRRRVFEASGGFPDIPLMEDVAFSKNLKRAGRVVALRSCVITSGRRWQQHGVLRTVLLMWWLRLLFFLGVTPDRLKQWYPDTR
jgi:rSAM/selenodomain-associated transferase 2